jgi:hypothetical protein
MERGQHFHGLLEQKENEEVKLPRHVAADALMQCAQSCGLAFGQAAMIAICWSWERMFMGASSFKDGSSARSCPERFACAASGVAKDFGLQKTD